MSGQEQNILLEASEQEATMARAASHFRHLKVVAPVVLLVVGIWAVFASTHAPQKVNASHLIQAMDLGDTLSSAQESVTDAAGSAQDAVKDSVGSAQESVQDAAGGAQDAVQDAAGNVQGAGEGIMGDMKDRAGSSGDQLRGAQGQMDSALKTKESGDGVGAKISNAVDGAQDAVDGASGALDDAQESLSNIGR